MKIRPIFHFLLLIWSPVVCFSQVHIEGEIRIVMKEGLIDCDFRLSNIPELDSYHILLNKGMNIQYFQTMQHQIIPYSGYYDGLMVGEALAYTFIDEKRNLQSMPEAFRIKYKGAFPIYEVPINSFDFKGNIAFNGKTLRATEQSKWYPVLYDIDQDKLLDEYSFNIRIICEDCQSIFINGDQPSHDNNKMFRSLSARQLMLFAGDYTFGEYEGNYLLNTSMDDKKSKQLFDELEKIKAFFSGSMEIFYEESIYILSHDPVTPFRNGRKWGFAIFPTFAYAGMDFNQLLDKKGQLSDSDFAFFAHELAHYYFGTNMLSGPQGWFWLESTAEYLSLKALEHFRPKFYESRLKEYSDILRNKNYPPLSEINEKHEIDDEYRYVFGPLLLVLFEQEFGKKTTLKILSELVRASADQTVTLDDFKLLALKNNIELSAYSEFENRFLKSGSAMQNTVELISGKK